MTEFIAHNMAPIMFASLVVFLLLGYPVAFSLAACGLIYFVVGVELAPLSHGEITLSWPLLGSLNAIPIEAVRSRSGISFRSAVGFCALNAITSAGILAPVAPIIGLDPVLIALAAGAGSLFCVHVTSNTFWLLQSLLGQSTRGALKTVTVGVSVASVVAILLILPMSALF